MHSEETAVTPHPIPYLTFNGNCAEAMHFYERALGGTLEMMLRNADMPFAAQVPKERAERIMHARLALPGGGTLYAGDCPPQMPCTGIQGLSLTLNFESVDAARSRTAAPSRWDCRKCSGLRSPAW